ncbi:hypothetical protein MXD61_12610 [Frankia sp. AgPm24]|uniref:Uncharacterized protein n=1 Tax=Frankia umida TaxID=573489 RepID=A0ABT0K5K4_9ACTN|nr:MULTISPECIES: hypothetical protein [Frankia]MCK9879070.1 hypothetical protein [Frankia umida]MCK9922698.1 hypothetical protein [Frankia sp. AgPm24]
MAIVGADVVGHEVDYWPAEVPFESDVEVRKYVPNEDLYWASQGNIRRVVVKYFHLPPIYYLMHWNRGVELAGLDAKVAAGRACKEDFSGAILAEVVGYICRFCDARLRAALADGGNPILSDDMSVRMSTHEFVEKCPVCHHQIMRNVVEFLPRL